jgi:hypothetical protein
MAVIEVSAMAFRAPAITPRNESGVDRPVAGRAL